MLAGYSDTKDEDVYNTRVSFTFVSLGFFSLRSTTRGRKRRASVQYRLIPEVFKLRVATRRDVAGVGEGNRVTELEIETNVICVDVNKDINYNYYRECGNDNETLDRLKFHFLY